MTASAAPAAAPVDAAVAPDSPAPHAAPDPALAEAIADVDKPVSAEPPAGATESLRDAIVAALKENPEIQIALARQDDARRGVREGRLAPLSQILSEIRRRTPGRQLDAGLESERGRPVYRVRWAALDGRRIDYIVDAESGRILWEDAR